MTTIKRAKVDDFWMSEKGAWRPARLEGGVRTAHMSCPKCGDRASLSTHKIDYTGKVSPSVVCPHDGCDFHECVVLEDWNKTTAVGG